MYWGGCRRVLMGIESGVDLLLGNVNKNITTAKVREGVANAKAAGIQTVGLFMIGMPGETPEMTKETVGISLWIWMWISPSSRSRFHFQGRNFSMTAGRKICLRRLGKLHDLQSRSRPTRLPPTRVRSGRTDQNAVLGLASLLHEAQADQAPND